MSELHARAHASQRIPNFVAVRIRSGATRNISKRFIPDHDQKRKKKKKLSHATRANVVWLDSIICDIYLFFKYMYKIILT